MAAKNKSHDLVTAPANRRHTSSFFGRAYRSNAPGNILDNMLDASEKKSWSIHDPRIGPFATLDLLGTLLAGVAIADYAEVSLVFVMLALMIVAIMVHSILEVPTALNYFLGLSQKPERLRN